LVNQELTQIDQPPFSPHDKMFCVYIAPNEERVYEHAHRGGFPADAVPQVRAIIDPTTAEAPAKAAV
jgi:hypothetical protein